MYKKKKYTYKKRGGGNAVPRQLSDIELKQAEIRTLNAEEKLQEEQLKALNAQKKLQENKQRQQNSTMEEIKQEEAKATENAQNLTLQVKDQEEKVKKAQTELEKAQTELEKAQKELEELKTKQTAAVSTAENQKLKSQLIAAAI